MSVLCCKKSENFYYFMSTEIKQQNNENGAQTQSPENAQTDLAQNKSPSQSSFTTTNANLLKELEIKKYELENKNSRLISQLGSMGDTDFLQKQLFILESIARKQNLPKKSILLDLEQLKQENVLGQNDSLATLQTKVKQMRQETEENNKKAQTLQADMGSRYSALQSFSISEKYNEDVNPRAKMSHVKEQYNSYQKGQLESLKMEIIQLNYQLQELQKQEAEYAASQNSKSSSQV